MTENLIENVGDFLSGYVADEQKYLELLLSKAQAGTPAELAAFLQTKHMPGKNQDVDRGTIVKTKEFKISQDQLKGLEVVANTAVEFNNDFLLQADDQIKEFANEDFEQIDIDQLRTTLTTVKTKWYA